ncbi:MAG TPA: hypothetical protein VFN35_23410 [Ktedonobacteraceae bacterium]|nr:hypothetical protein [Ktedonobacteraceae bacterium]
MQDRDQYVYFTIKLLKGSFALNALWQDALNYHMIDQPDKLIALRITEYYELVSRGALRPGPSMLGVAPSPAPMPPAMPAQANFGNNGGPPPPPANVSGKLPEFSPPTPIPASPPPANPQPANPSPAVPAQLEGANASIANAPVSAVEQNAEDAADYWAPL